MRYFFISGEASGEQTAVFLAQALREFDPLAHMSGVGAERMETAGFRVICRTDGWASLGPLSALGKIPRLLIASTQLLRVVLREAPDLLILIDFGAFNVRFAWLLRRCGYRKPILYAFPPAAWLDREKAARAVAKVAVPLVPFTHQRDFYASLGIGASYYGHPLVSVLSPRPSREPAPADGGHLALLPGSREAEIRYHLPLLLETVALLRRKRPALTFELIAADTALAQRFAAATAAIPGAQITSGVRARLGQADAAVIASGTAVLEAALLEVPTVALYVLSKSLAKIARRMKRPRYVTLPNLLLDKMIVPELLQEAATPRALAQAAEALLTAPTTQLADFAQMRAMLGTSASLGQWAKFAFELARSGG